MKADDIRRTFLDFFKEKKHTIVPSSSLLPDSPNLLFTNAGMNQFVPYFLGQEQVPYRPPRVADTQKCIRAGGKHNDLDDVGFDTYHHTFFEMLGNWSFGDYFKKEAIEWAWELLVERWKFPAQRLYATVYQPGPGEPSEFDQEAYDHWEKLFREADLDPAIHIVSGGKADNFWNATTGLLGFGYAVNYKKHFGKPPSEVRVGEAGGFDAHLIEDHKGPNAPHMRGSWYHIWSNIKGHSVDTADSSFGGFQELGKALKIPANNPVFKDLEEVRQFANHNDLRIASGTIEGQTLVLEDVDESWEHVTTQIGNVTVTVYKQPDPASSYRDFLLPGQESAEYERKRLCEMGNPAACDR